MFRLAFAVVVSSDQQLPVQQGTQNILLLLKWERKPKVWSFKVRLSRRIVIGFKGVLHFSIVAIKNWAWWSRIFKYVAFEVGNKVVDQKTQQRRLKHEHRRNIPFAFYSKTSLLSNCPSHRYFFVQQRLKSCGRDSSEKRHEVRGRLVTNSPFAGN